MAGANESAGAGHVLRRRAFGVLKGKLKLPKSFFDPPSQEELQDADWVEQER